MISLSQIEQQVKLCANKWCDEDIFRDGPLCFDHFIEMETQTWDDEDTARQMVLESVGYIFGDPMGVPA